MKLSEILEDKRVSMGIAKALSPFDTGNLRFNAIKSELTADGFRIRYSLGNAYYIYFLEEGTSKSTRHMGFIANRTVPMIASYLYSKYENPNQKKVNRFKYVAKKAENDINFNEKRDMLHEESLSKDLEAISTIKGKEWGHETDNEIYDPNFMERSI